MGAGHIGMEGVHVWNTKLAGQAGAEQQRAGIRLAMDNIKLVLAGQLAGKAPIAAHNAGVARQPW